MNERLTVNGEQWDGERLTVNGERFRNLSSCASLTKAEGRKSKISAIVHRSLSNVTSHIVHCSLLIVTLSAPAAEIWTEEWGTFWKCPEPKNKYKSIYTHETPGSDDYGTVSNKARIARHFYYAWMDGFDTREWAMTNLLTTSQPPSPETNMPSYARFAFRTNFLSRLSKMRGYEIGPTLTADYYTDGVFWGSTAMDEVFENLGWPAKEDFYWTKDPTDKCWDYGTAWLPAFATLDPYIYESNFYPAESGVYQSWCGGIAAKKGWHDVVWPDDPDFGGYVRAASSEDAGGYYYATMDKDFEYVISNTFDSVIRREAIKTNVLNYVSYTGGRLYYDTIATADQALACFDKTYHFPGDLISVTNETKGHGNVTYKLEGTVRKKLTVRGGDDPFIGFEDGEYASTHDWHITERTNSLSLTRGPCGYTSPRAGASGITTEAPVSGRIKDGDAPLASWPITLAEDDLGGCIFWLLGELGTSRATMTLRFSGWGAGVSYGCSVNSGSIEISGTKGASISDNTNLTVTASAAVHFDYYFNDSMQYVVYDNPNIKWLYPSNAYYVGSATLDKPGFEFNFFLSYARCNAYDESDLSAVNNWSYIDDYKYRFWHEDGYQASGYLPALGYALTINTQAAAWAFDSKIPYNPLAYVGATDAEVIACVSGAKCTGGTWAYTLYDQHGHYTEDDEVIYVNIPIWIDGDGIARMQPSEFHVGEVGVVPTFSNSSSDPLDRPGDRTCETRIKGITEVRWNFPQVKFDSL